MNYLDILLPIGMIVFGGLLAYLIGFIIGRRSAYKDVDNNFEVSKPIGLMKKQTGAESLLHSQIIK